MAISVRLLHVIQRAAEMKASGSSWQSIATASKRTLKTVKEWPQIHADLWQELFAKYEKQFLEEATAESVIALRKQLRADAATVSIQAADKLIKYRVSRGKSTLKSAISPVVTTAEERDRRFAKELREEARQAERESAHIDMHASVEMMTIPR